MVILEASIGGFKIMQRTQRGFCMKESVNVSFRGKRCLFNQWLPRLRMLLWKGQNVRMLKLFSL